MSGLVRAAGCVVLRRTDDGRTETALIHRPKYDDWTFPKGKLDEGETFEQAAIREVEEETGLRGRLDRELPEVRYVDNRGRDKVVRYWTMTPTAGEFTPGAEVDELRWMTLEEAADMLSYQHDRDLLRALPAE